MISVVLATYNEEHNITRCLKSVSKFADEIIVVDGHSTDQTVFLAKNLDAKVITTTNKPNFHINKQLAMDKAKGDLILQLDADEVIDEFLAKFIIKTHQELKKNATKLPSAWYIKRRNFFLGRFLKKGGQYPDMVIRLYQKGKAKLPQKDVHEQMIVDGEVGIAEGHLLHYPYPDFKEYLRKWHRYADFQAHQLHDKNVKVNFINTWQYMIWLPMLWFSKIFIRHKGFVDGMAGFIFALFSGLLHPMSYLKLWEMRVKK